MTSPGFAARCHAASRCGRSGAGTRVLARRPVNSRSGGITKCAGFPGPGTGKHAWRPGPRSAPIRGGPRAAAPRGSACSHAHSQVLASAQPHHPGPPCARTRQHGSEARRPERPSQGRTTKTLRAGKPQSSEPRKRRVRGGRGATTAALTRQGRPQGRRCPLDQRVRQPLTAQGQRRARWVEQAHAVRERCRARWVKQAHAVQGTTRARWVEQSHAAQGP